MPDCRPSVHELAKWLADAMGSLGEADARLALGLYRLLAHGSPVALARLAEGVGLDADVVRRIVSTWSGVVFDEQGSVEGFWGLAVREVSPHRLEVFGGQLSTWCAWDPLFLPRAS